MLSPDLLPLLLALGAAHALCGDCHLSADPGGTACLECHEVQGHADLGASRAPLNPVPIDYGCSSCHNVHAGGLVAEEPGLCLGCHPVAGETRSAAGWVRHPAGERGVTCYSCHAPHGEAPFLLLWLPAQQAAGCGACHRAVLEGDR